MENVVQDTGISVAYEPEGGLPAVDILFVHGLGGHPRKSWTSSRKTPGTLKALPPFESSTRSPRGSVLRRALGRFRRKPRNEAAEAGPETLSDYANTTAVFWPVDLLSKDLPNARILMFGYDSKITKYSAGAVSENSVFSHAKDLLFALTLERTLHRPLICVAHSLGGIIVKEMLSRSSSSSLSEHQNIVESVTGVIFFGTPHRGSVDIAAKGEIARSLLSAIGVATSPVILDSLGLKNTDLERAQEEFSRLWQTNNFRVKTFQEGLIFPKFGKKLVPNYSSLIGNHRENAETLQADHVDMCRYSGKDDPNYRKVVGEIRSTYLMMATKRMEEPIDQLPRRIYSPVPTSVAASQRSENDFHDQANREWLQSLWFPAIDRRYETLGNPAEQTCHWLFDNAIFQNWLDGENQERHQGLVWIKGKPGSGKSMLMREAFRRVMRTQTKASDSSQIAAFFFNSKGDELEHSLSGLFRSLIYQLCSKAPIFLQSLQEIWDAKIKTGCFMTSQAISWYEAELKTAFQKIVLQQSNSKVLIFVDALDECDSSRVRDLAYFWRGITKSAFALGMNLKVCLSSRHSPSVTVSDCPEIVMEQHNSHDISTYLKQRIEVGIGIQNAQWQLLEEKITERSDGMFLWVVLVVDDLLRSWDEGKSIEYLTRRVENTPQALDTLFSDMLSNSTHEAKEVAVKLFQWVILSTKPLRLHEWHHIMGFIRYPAPRSLAEWRASDYFTATDEQLGKQINTLSLGLVEVTRAIEVPLDASGSELSVGVDAGSLTLEHGSSRIVQVIHESVRDFFLRGNGFLVLDPSLSTHPIGRGHLSIMATCLDYVQITELDALVWARQRLIDQKNDKDKAQSPMSSAQTNSEGSLSVCSIGNERHLPQGTFTLPIHHKSNPKGTRASDSVMTSLSESHLTMDIHRWLSETCNLTLDSDVLSSITCAQISDGSDTFRTQILEDHPALLSYATFALFVHAQLAHSDGADPTPILDRLADKTTWARWKSLIEDVPEEVDLLDFLDDWSLVSWVTAFLNRFNLGHEGRRSPVRGDVATCQIATRKFPRSSCYDLPRSDIEPGIFAELLSAPQDISQEHILSVGRPDESPQSLDHVPRRHGRVPRRRGSVASFGSASSHDGSDRIASQSLFRGR